MALHKFNKSNFLLKEKIKNNKRKNIKAATIGLSIMILVVGILIFSFARYESNKSFTLINAKVGAYGDVVIAAVVDGQTQTSFPDKETYKLQNVECKDSNNNIITSMFDTKSWGIYIPETNGKTKCIYSFTTSEVEEHTLNPTTATGNAFSGEAGSLNGSSTLTDSTQLNLNDYKQNDQYHFNLGGGEQVTFPSGFYSSPINISNGEKAGGSSSSQTGSYTIGVWHNKEYGNNDGVAYVDLPKMATKGVISISGSKMQIGRGNDQYNGGKSYVSCTISNTTKGTSVSYTSPTTNVPWSTGVTGYSLAYDAGDQIHIDVVIYRSDSWGIYGEITYSITSE